MKMMAEVANGCVGCPGAQMAAALPATMRRQKASLVSLAALLLPGLLFGSGLILLREDARFAWLSHLSQFPWELWVIALCGALATLGGLADWGFHRWVARCVISQKERNCELLALAGGGVPMFALMSAATVMPHPQSLLVPILVVLLFTASLICYDEFIFHKKRCKRLETVFHRLLVFGNGTAWLAWFHWCFARG